MGALQRLIDRIAAGEITAEDAVPELRAVLVTSRPRPEPGSAEWLAAEWDVDDTDTWTDVEATRIAGKLHQEQYDVLRGLVTLRIHAPQTASGEVSKRPSPESRRLQRGYH